MTTNHAPTAMSTNPLQRFTAGPVILTGRSDEALIEATERDAVARSTTKTKAAAPNAATVAACPTVRDCTARPASNGPVQPNPANR